ncbi:MAG: hypothetical protein QM778_16915 [Myxococcales bacterium]
MRTKTASLALGSVLLLAACAGTQKRSQPSQLAWVDCTNVSGDAVAALYAPGNIKKVRALYRKEFIARAIQPEYVAGAEIQIPAQPGMHDAYMQRELSCHARKGTGPDASVDPLRVQGVDSVAVRSKGHMTHISITSTDHAAAKKILRQAESLHESSGSVTVDQLSAGTPGHSAF